jgi:hypothetical protein
MRTVWRLSAHLTVVLAWAVCAEAQTVGSLSLSPASVPVGAGTPVTVSTTITDPSVAPGGVLLQRYDSQGRVVASLGTLTDDGQNGDAVAGDRRYSRQLTVYELTPGPITLRASVAFQGRIVRVLSAPATLTVTGTASTITITTPVNFDYRNVSPIVVTGTVGDPGAQVRINGVDAAVTGQAYTAQVPILEGTNTLTAVATNTNGTATTASVQITLDTTPPKVSINAPDAGGTTSAASVAVSGLVNDIVVGTVNPLQATVTVNGAGAQVANRSFLVPNVPLVLGPNSIQATATDRGGNSATASIVVIRVPANGAVALVSGNNQSAPTGSLLPQPLVARLTDALGQPVAGVPVVFRVVENSGGIVSGTSALGSLAVLTNAQGQASATFRLGTRSGVGNNVVEATATGFAGAAVFTHSATPTAAQRIVVDTGNGQLGPVGQALALPFVAIVTDAGFNRIGSVPVTFTVKQGGGTINGLTTLTTTSDADGRVAAVLTLGRQEGQDNNVVEATFAGNPGLPAAFLASGKVPADPAQTRITGVVLDNANHAIPGVTMRLFRTHQNTGLPEAVTTPVVTGENGQFSIQPAPVGAFKLMADGSTAPNGPWPTLEFDIVTIAGQTIDVGLPIYLPVLDAVNRLCVSETTGGTLTLPQVPGFSLTLAPGSATFAGGSRTGCVSVTPVNGDKVPMSPGFGQQPRFVITIQPVGTVFNPAARLTLPNVDGLAPRQVTEMYSYDHDLAAFVSIGTGTVSEDGSVIASDPGVGVIKAGWHCGGNPNPTGSAGTCPTCQTCQGTQCVPSSGTPPQASPTDCRRQICQNGGVATVNNDGETPAQASATDCRRQVCQGGSVASIDSNSEQPTNVCDECSGGAPTSRADGSTPADANACCFQGQRIAKFGQELGILLDGPLVTQCPQRTQNDTSGGPFSNGMHEVDGCSGGVPPNTQNPMQNGFYPFGLLNQAPTAFGQPIVGSSGTTIPVSTGAIGSLPCNQHDLCYQTCVGDSASQTSAARAACDDAMETRMDAVCEAAYPSTCPGSLGTLECASYHIQRADCFAYSGIYRAGLGAFGGSAFAERQTQFCQCCQ